MDRPSVLSSFFRDSNCVDQHNHVRQHELGLEKKWVTHNCWFRLTTSKIGLDVTDTWQLMRHHRLFELGFKNQFKENDNKDVPIKALAGQLAAQLLKRANKIEDELVESRKKRGRFVDGSDEEEGEGIDQDGIEESESIDEVNDKEGHGLTFETKIGRKIKGCKLITTYKDGNGNLHTLCKFPVIQTGRNMKKRSRIQSCKTCGKESTFFCFECQKAFCYCEDDNAKGHGRRCFKHHVPSRTSSRFST